MIEAHITGICILVFKIIILKSVLILRDVSARTKRPYSSKVRDFNIRLLLTKFII